MPYEIIYLEEGGGVITNYWGTITDEDIIESGEEKYLSLSKLRNYRYAITDLSRVKESRLTSKGIKKNAEISRKIFAEIGDIIVAFVLPTDADYGMGRMWQAYGDMEDKYSRICRTRAEAEKWIRTSLKNNPPF